MAGYKAPDFNERSAAARAAKQTALEKLQNKSAPDPEVIAARQAANAARDQVAAERRAARQEAAAAEKAAKAEAKAQRLAEKEAEAAKAEAAKPTEADLKAARDARYAARKARKR